MSVDVTVAICTWNRAKILDQTLARMRELAVPPGLTWELLVVNNNCTDDTDAVATRHAAGLPVRLVHEPKPGVANARNTAIRETRSSLLIWADDDVLVAPNWLAEYVAAEKAFPEAGFFAGPLEPWFEADPPADLLAHLPTLRAAFALVDHGTDVRRMTDGEHPFGANSAYRTEVVRRFGFDPRLGRTAGSMLGDEETVLLEQIRAAGLYGVWIGTARARHFIPKDRATWAYVWRYYHGLGQTVTRRQGLPACPTLFGKPRWAVRACGAKQLGGWLLRQFGRPGWVARYTRAAYIRGVFAELARYRAAGGAATAGFLVPPGAGL